MWSGPVILNVNVTVCFFVIFDNNSSCVGIFMVGAGPGIQLVFLKKKYIFKFKI